MRILFTLVLLFSFVMVDGQIVRTVHQTFHQEEAQLLELDVKAEVEIEEWTGSRILVETTISLEGANINIIEALIEAGRYELKMDQNGKAMKLNFQNLEKKLMVRNAEILEILKMKVFVPEGMQFDESLVSN